MSSTQNPSPHDAIARAQQHDQERRDKTDALIRDLCGPAEEEPGTYYVKLDFTGALYAENRADAEAQAKAIIREQVHRPGYLLDVSPIRAEAHPE